MTATRTTTLHLVLYLIYPLLRYTNMEFPHVNILSVSEMGNNSLATNY